MEIESLDSNDSKINETNKLESLDVNFESEENIYSKFKIENFQLLANYDLNEDNNYFKGCKWAPDGSCFITNSNDYCIKLYNLPKNLNSFPINFNDPFEVTVEFKIKESSLIYDYCFNPNLNSMDSSSCFFLTTSSGSPIHMWDAYNGNHLNNYVALNHLEEPISAYSIEINSNTNKIYAGYKNSIKIFDLNRPGRNFETLETQYKKEGQTGLISCLTVNPTNTNIFAAGSYSKQLALYSENDFEQICVLLGHNGGLTHLKFSLDGTKLYTGSRKENEIFCWDMRNLSDILYTFKRSTDTNQRIYFDLTYYSEYLASGDVDGFINLWDVKNIDSDEKITKEPLIKFKAHNDCLNGISFHPYYPLLLTCSGQRKFKELDENECNQSLFKNKKFEKENSLKLWWLTNFEDFNNYHQSKQ